MLVATLRRITGVSMHVATMSVALHTIRARRGRPKPMVGCPWSQAAKTRRLRQIQALLDRLPADEVAVYEDEVDIHLNPKIGLDWMLAGQQKQVLTPGQNEKRYLAGAQDVRTGECPQSAHGQLVPAHVGWDRVRSEMATVASVPDRVAFRVAWVGRRRFCSARPVSACRAESFPNRGPAIIIGVPIPLWSEPRED
jgi:hypothetical protein